MLQPTLYQKPPYTAIWFRQSKIYLAEYRRSIDSWEHLDIIAASTIHCCAGYSWHKMALNRTAWRQFTLARSWRLTSMHAMMMMMIMVIMMITLISELACMQPSDQMSQGCAMQAAPWKDIIQGTLAASLLQVLLALPFLWQHPGSYISKAFEFSRIFLLKWSVNWSFLPEAWFRSQQFAACLLTAHIWLLLLFAQYRWCQAEGGFIHVLVHRISNKAKSAALISKNANSLPSNTQRMLLTVFTGNLIGILCARTLHFQFYSWYFHTLPFLAWQASFSTPLCVLLLLCIEVCWNVFPTSSASSAVLLVCHCIILARLWYRYDRTREVKSD